MSKAIGNNVEIIRNACISFSGPKGAPTTILSVPPDVSDGRSPVYDRILQPSGIFRINQNFGLQGIQRGGWFFIIQIFIFFFFCVTFYKGILSSSQIYPMDLDDGIKDFCIPFITGSLASSSWFRFPTKKLP